MSTAHTGHRCPNCGHKLNICGWAYVDREDLEREIAEANKAIERMTRRMRRRRWWVFGKRPIDVNPELEGE